MLIACFSYLVLLFVLRLAFGVFLCILSFVVSTIAVGCLKGLSLK